jgi:hypothetical protein
MRLVSRPFSTLRAAAFHEEDLIGTAKRPHIHSEGDAPAGVPDAMDDMVCVFSKWPLSGPGRRPMTETKNIQLVAPTIGLPSLEPECPRRSSQVGHVAFAMPGDLATPTGGYRYDRRIIQELRRLGWQVDILDLGDGFPFPSGAQRAMALVRLSAVPRGCPVVFDGLAFGVLPEAGRLQSRTPLIALVHQPRCARSWSRYRTGGPVPGERARRAGHCRPRRGHE